jgi:hypothetical protein
LIDTDSIDGMNIATSESKEPVFHMAIPAKTAVDIHATATTINAAYFVFI